MCVTQKLVRGSIKHPTDMGSRDLDLNSSAMASGSS